MAIKVTKITPEFSDSRGYISRIVDQDKIKIRGVLYIFSKKNSIRGNHYHKKDYHYIYCLKGHFIYSEKKVNSRGSFSSVVLNPGDLVLTKPMTIHKMEFLKDTVFLAITTETREQESYEEDTVRIQDGANDKK